MSKEIVVPEWVSVLSLAVALFVPLGVTLIADTSVDEGNGTGIVQQEVERFVPPDAWFAEPVRGVPEGSVPPGYRSEDGGAEGRGFWGRGSGGRGADATDEAGRLDRRV